MRSYRFEIVLAAVLGAAFVALYLWQTPSLWQSPLSAPEVDRFMAALDRQLVQPPEERTALIERLRAWAVKDDGKAVLMLNLMRYNDSLGALPPGISFTGTPAEANAIYEQAVTPLALKQGEYPLLITSVQSGNLLGHGGATQRWDRVVVMRAPNRRAFLQFLSDPAYGPLAPYKTAAAQVELIPLSADAVVPDIRLIAVAALVAIFFGAGWLRSARR